MVIRELDPTLKPVGLSADAIIVVHNRGATQPNPPRIPEPATVDTPYHHQTKCTLPSEQRSNTQTQTRLKNEKYSNLNSR